jgi:NRAMP (natural resistance-associated macrophage protein)-like metal ion transporter
MSTEKLRGEADKVVPARPGPNGHKKDRPVIRKWHQVLGPGLVTGAADDDPSGIATYSQVGAQFGYGMLWVSLFAYPLMCAIQEISGRIGRTTGRGIAANLRRYYSPWLLFPLIFITVVANTINLAADLGAMGEGLKLLAPRLPQIGCVIAFTLVTILSIVFISYTEYSKWL